jgi:hypothetical protein
MKTSLTEQNTFHIFFLKQQMTNDLNGKYCHCWEDNFVFSTFKKKRDLESLYIADEGTKRFKEFEKCSITKVYLIVQWVIVEFLPISYNNISWFQGQSAVCCQWTSENKICRSQIIWADLTINISCHTVSPNWDFILFFLFLEKVFYKIFYFLN